MPDLLTPRGTDPAVGFTPNAAAPTSAAVIALILGMTYAQISQAILTGNGTIWKQTVLSSAQINTLFTNTIQLIAPPGAGKTIQPVYASTESHLGAATYSAAPTVCGFWDALVVCKVPTDGLTNTANLRQCFLERIDDGSVGTGNNVTNSGYSFAATADTTLGSGSVGATIGYCVTPGL